MTGEMSKADVTSEEYPLHFAVAKALGGTVEPFDVYQGPYVLTPAHERLFLTNNDGVSGCWWNEATSLESAMFPCDGAMAEILAVSCAETLMLIKPDEQILVSLSRAQCHFLRSLLYEAAQYADSDEQEGFIADIASQFEQAES